MDVDLLYLRSNMGNGSKIQNVSMQGTLIKHPRLAEQGWNLSETTDVLGVQS